MSALSKTQAPPAQSDPLAGSDWHDIRRVNVRRTMVLAGAGAIIGLLMAGYGLFTAKGTSTFIVPPEDVALVNQQPISRSDYLTLVQSTYSVDFEHATPAQRKHILDDMIREELFVQRAQELDIAATDPDVRNALVNAVEGEVAVDAITQQPSEEKLENYYETHKEKYSNEGTMVVRDLVFSPAQADAAAAALKAGTPPDAVLAQFHGRDSGKVSGEEFYFAAKIHLGDKVFAAARALADGAISSPLVQDDGVHILAMAKNTLPVPLDFARAHGAVLSDYRTDAIKRLKAGDEVFFRKRANILIAPDLR